MNESRGTDRGHSPRDELPDAEYRTRLQTALGPDYELEGFLGQGGMGSVYAARDKRLDRVVAVKALRHDVFPSRVAIERFQREAKALAKLRHSNILPVYAVGEGDGLAFMITPRIDGLSLRELIDRDGALPWQEAARIAAEIARALAAAHRLGIIHRDVKPDNILLEGPDRHALLADFGIAKTADEESALTMSGSFVGSPRYMSPEQLSGDPNIDHRADIYALGAATHEMLTGEPAFSGENLQRLIMQKLTSEPPSLLTIDPAIPSGISEAVLRCIAREATDRWSSATDVARAFVDQARAPTAIEGAQSSWFARRGLILFALMQIYIYLVLVGDIFEGATGGPVTNFALDVIIKPLATLFELTFAVLTVELLLTMRRSRAGGATWREVKQDAFGQPRWWLAWYPRSLRNPASAWRGMSPGVKALRTILFVEMIAIPLVIPLTLLVPVMVPVTAGAGIPLPLPMRVLFWTGRMAAPPLAILLALVALTIGLIAVRRKVSPASVTRELVRP